VTEHACLVRAGQGDLFDAKKLPNTLAAFHDENVVRRTDFGFL